MFAKLGMMLSSIAVTVLALAPCAAFAADAVPASEKSETVRVNAAADGAQKDVEVEVSLKNPEAAEKLLDVSDLSDIEPDDESQTYTRSGDTLTWLADGDDVAYKGKTSAEVPVSISIEYKLNGQIVPAGEMAGKSGKVAIRYDYANTSSVSGYANVRVPFTAVTTLMFDGDDFKNVEVENGRVVNDGDDIIAVGYAMPGLKQSLGSVADDIDIPEYFQVTADVADFELKSALTLVTAGLFEGIDPADLDSSEMSDASSSLAEATDGLVDATDGLADGLEALSKGTDSLATGADALDEGLSELAANLPEIATGISGLSKASASLAKGAKGVYGGASKLSDAVEQAEELSAQAAEGLAALKSAGKSAADLIDQVLEDEESELSKDSKADLKKALALLRDGEDPLVGQLEALAKSAGALTKTLSALEDSLGDDDETDTLVGGAYAVKEGAEQLNAGLAKLDSGTGPLVEGVNALVYGADQLADGASQLDEGAREAAKGAGELADGMKTYRDEAIAEIIDAIDNKVVNLSQRMTALTAAADAYGNFSGLAVGTKGSVKFVITTEAIAGE